MKIVIFLLEQNYQESKNYHSFDVNFIIFRLFKKSQNFLLSSSIHLFYTYLKKLVSKMNGSTYDEQTLLRDFNQTQPNHSWSDFLSTGPSHMPIFIINLCINDAQFEGCGSSKKRAKISAIKKFISSINDTEMNSSVECNTMQNKKRKLTENLIEHQPPLKKQNMSTNYNIKEGNSIEHCPLLKPQVMDTSINIVPQTSPISILNEMFTEQTLVYEYEGLHGILETMSVCVSGNKYIGYGRNRKEAKEIASRNALKALYEVHPIHNKYKDQIEMLRTDYYEAKIIDRFAFITDAMYQKLDIKNHKNKEYSVIASIIKVNL